MSDTVLSRRIRQVLAAAGPGAAAAALCRATTGALEETGQGLSSVYLARGDRLRCMAVSGYGQLYDGIPPGEGVIGRAFLQGRTLHVRADAEVSGYRAAADGVREELSVALVAGGQCLGVLNVETRTSFSRDEVIALQYVGDALAAAIGASGGPPAESTAQRLVRHATALAAADDLPRLAGALLAGAVDLTDRRSACLLGPGRVLAASGPSAGPLRGLTGEVVREALGWVELGGSSRTSGDHAAPPGPAQAGLASAGLRSFVLVPLLARGELLGGLVVGDDRPEEVPPDTVEALELLAALAAADLRSLRAADVLRRQARTDDLTGLPHRRAFAEALDAALLSAAPGTPAVLLIDLDGFKAVNDGRGHQAGDEVLARTAKVLSSALRATDVLFRIGGDEFAALIPVAGDDDLAHVAERLLQAARQTDVTVSIGAAVADTGRLTGDHLVRVADERLYEAKRQGRDRACLPTAPRS